MEPKILEQLPVCKTALSVKKVAFNHQLDSERVTALVGKSLDSVQKRLRLRQKSQNYLIVFYRRRLLHYTQRTESDKLKAILRSPATIAIPVPCTQKSPVPL